MFLHVVADRSPAGLHHPGACSITRCRDEGLERGEFYALVLFAVAGMGILAGANELVTAFVGLEISSIASYVLVGYPQAGANFQ